MNTYATHERGMAVGWVVAIVALIVIVGIIFAIDQTGENESRLGALNDPSENETGTGTQATTTQQNSVLLSDLETGGFAMVERATFTRPGYIVIYRVNSNTDTAIIGHSRLLAVGTHTNVNIQLDMPIARNQAIIAVLHADDRDSVFEFPGSDTYLLSAQGGIVSDVDVVDIAREDEMEVLASQVERFLNNTATTTATTTP